MLKSPFFILLLLLVLMSPLAQAATDCAAVTDIPSTECEALVALYNSTDGANWHNKTGWNVTNTPCSWYRVTCSGGHVSRLYLSSNHLTGSIPTELGNLSNLTSLDLYSNLLIGSIPTELGNLSNLTSLDLKSNRLTGSIPRELGNLTNLEKLMLNSNQLTGSIPTELGNLSNLEKLMLNSNHLTGSIPTELGNLSNLQYLGMSENSLSGSIPTELGNLSNLTWLYLFDNQLCGEIPVEFQNLPLSFNSLDNNHLTASDSSLIAWLDNRCPGWDTTQTSCSGFFTTPIVKVAENAGTVTLTVQRNGDTNGTLEIDYATTEGSARQGDDYIGATGTLNWADGDVTDKSFTITINDDSNSEINETFTITLTSPVSGEILDNATIIINDPFDCAAVTQIPSTECEALVALYNSTDGANWEVNWRWNVTDTPCSWYGVGCSGGHVSKIDLSGNQLSGSIPTELGNLSNLRWLWLYSNELTGSIPRELGNLSYLRELHLGGNQLTGSIPSELGNLSYLRELHLSPNELTGSIPSELGNLSNLRWLYLSHNELTSSIPSELGNLSNLRWLYLSHNELTGSIPTELGNLTYLTRLWLYSNELTGSIPTELGNLTYLEKLYLYSNQLTSSIPSELGNLSYLRELDLGGNQLTGSIPSELGNLSNLEKLMLNSNQLTSSIPIELGNLSNLQSLSLSENSLSGEIPSELSNLSNLWKLHLDNNSLCGEIPVELKNLSLFLKLDNNQLTASDSSLIAWLDIHNPGWDTTQTSCSGFFTTPIVKVAENAGSVTLTVQRNGDTNGTLEIDYATTEGSARQGDDYIGATGTLNWADGDVTDKSFTITINDDSNSEINETFTITLTSPVSGEILDNATIIINNPFDCAAVTQIPFTECEALVALYNSTDGDNWESNSGWNVTNIPCYWRGVFCSGGHVSRLALSRNQLTGTIPTELGNLSNLESLELAWNNLTGEIPTELGNLTNLWALYLSNNQLTGEIPTELGNLPHLGEISLSDNQLTGEIPTELGNLIPLWILYLSNNSLCGEIPVELKNLSNIGILRLDNNHLTASDSVLIAWLDSRNPGWETTQTPCPIGTLQFSSTTYSVTENGGQATITVTRAGGNNGTISANYATTDDTATAGNDYTQTTGTLYWSDGDSADKTITITITDDGDSEGNETFTITLTDPISGENLDNATVTISDNDTTLVTLNEFTAMALENEIILEWQTATEFDNAGFHLWRATGEDWKYGDYSTVIRLTEQLIAAQGDFSVYSYIDTDVETGATYYYGLEDIDLYGQSTYHWNLIDSATAR